MKRAKRGLSDLKIDKFNKM